MSKRKVGEERGEDGLGEASKKRKIAHAESSGSRKSVERQEDGGVAADYAGFEGKKLKQARIRARKERKMARKEMRDENEPAKEDEQKTSEKPAIKKVKPKKEKRKTHRQSGSGWQVSDAVGGQLVDLDPIFSAEEDHLILAYEFSIRIYATSTSLLIRTLSTSTNHGSITGFALSDVDPCHLYVCMNQGLVEKWDWKVGQRLGKWTISSQLFGIAVTSKLPDESAEDLVYTVESRHGSWTVTGNYLRDMKGQQQTEEHTLLRSVDPITSLRVSNSGGVLVVAAGNRLVTGQLVDPKNATLKDMTYTWREIVCPEWITSMDARMDTDHKYIAKRVADEEEPTASKAMDVVVGGLKGSVFVYQGLLRSLIEKERKPHAAAPVSRLLHWHRNGVGAVKWSRDGNYIISGGVETVLVLWQLDTGQRQLLPHLSAPIESIVVSPAGSSYAIRLADNSAMVLSTAELEPTVSVSGVQVAISRRPMIQLPDIPRVSESLNVVSVFRRFAGAVSRSTHGQLLLAVPGSLPSRIGVTNNPSAAYLQTLDVRSGSQIARQALTRTKVTDRNIGPESNLIVEPNVVLLQTSHDGKWLATVEEWIPPRKDIQFLAIDAGDIGEEQKFHIEIYLKFWQWDEVSKQWKLVSRIEAPHLPTGSSSDSPGKILDLVEDPSSTGFATIGDEGMLKFWKPKIRYRDGIKVKGKDGQNLVTWICWSTTSLTLHVSDHIDGQLCARLAFSLDGSLLAAGVHSASTSLLYMIDAENGDIRTLCQDMFSGLLINLGIIDRHLVVLADTLLVWDIVDDWLTYEIPIPPSGTSPAKQRAAMHLAVDQRAQTFAVVIPEATNSRSRLAFVSRLAVFSPASPTPVFSTALPHTLFALLSMGPKRGYLTLDSAAEVRALTPAVQLPTMPIELAVEPPPPGGLDNIYGTRIGSLLDKSKSGKGLSSLLAPETKSAAPAVPDEDDAAVVRPHQLAEIFETQNSFALPPVTALFERVAGLFAGRREG
ncbi:hypothetical protein MMC13_002671 [Lambiella insularis]|nr:hypothetical protein [Lambiella insularis]